MAVLKSSLILSLIDNVSGRARGINSALGGLQRSHASFLGMGARLVAFGAAYMGVTQGINATAGAAIRFESAFADVRKVVDANDEQFENMRRTIKQMSTELPLAATDIAAIFAAAGEAGVATADLKTFSEMAARVGIAFDMSAGAAGESLAKLKTQLGLTVLETGDMADAINHLSNNMASKAKDITSYMLRVGALAEMGGFAKEEIAAIGSAMIAAGAESETAGTAMQNVVKAMTRGSFAKTGQRQAAKALGLDLPTIAKQMQKDAPKALKKVLTAISRAPKDQHIALLSQFFGDEAKAFAPLIGNIGLLDQALDSVSDKAKYGGSAFREFVERSKTTANVLQLLRNRIANVFEGIGEQMLPSIKEAASGIGDVLDTLDERATVFDRMGTAMQAFLQGFGVDSGIRETINGLGDLLFGKADGSESADQLGRVFAKFKEYGASVRELSDAIRSNPIAQFLGEIGSQGFKLMLAAVGIGILAGSIRKLAGALLFLSGASTAFSILKTLAKLKGLPGAADVPVPGAKPKPVPAGKGGFAALLAVTGIAAMLAYAKRENATNPAWKERQKRADQHTQQNVDFFKNLVGIGGTPDTYTGSQVQLSAQRGNSTNPLQQAVDNSRNPVIIDSGSIAAMTQPNGVQQVAVTNAQPVSVNVNNTFNITGVNSPESAADAAAARVGQAAKAAVESSFSGGGGF